MSCCRGNTKDPNLEFFEKIEQATFAISQRTTESIVEDSENEIRWQKLKMLKQQLSNIEFITGKTL